jgi:hypothetical protein
MRRHRDVPVETVFVETVVTDTVLAAPVPGPGQSDITRVP